MIDPIENTPQSPGSGSGQGVHEAGPRLVSLGWDARVASRFDALLRDGSPDGARSDARALVPARVALVQRGTCIVATEDGDDVVTPSTPLAVGDWVALGAADGGDGGAGAGDDGALEVTGPVARWSELARRDPETERIQVIAANVDLVLVTVPGDRANLARVERETVLAWASGARPVAVVTKGDVTDRDLAGDLSRRLADVEVVVTSAVTGQGLAELAALLVPSRTGVLLGASGAGKSTLANALLGEARLATGAVRGSDARGRHTTTRRELVVLPGGGVLVDTPGLRSLGLVGDEGITAAFADIERLADGCRFRDCAHDHEPGCAVLAAVAEGTLAAERFAGYQKLMSEATDRRPPKRR